jgi:hypothetical protein
MVFILLIWGSPVSFASKNEAFFFLPTDSVDTLLAGSVTVIQSEQVSRLVKLQIDHNKALKEIDGFRIQIFSENGPNAKTDAATARLTFKNKFAGIEAYLSYKQPYFKICVGDFKNQLDARATLLKLLRSYPNAIIVREKVLP